MLGKYEFFARPNDLLGEFLLCFCSQFSVSIFTEDAAREKKLIYWFDIKSLFKVSKKQQQQPRIFMFWFPPIINKPLYFIVLFLLSYFTR
jgi:hypothetical protein